jgi:hypothetical protein
LRARTRATAVGVIASQVRIGDFRAGTTVLVALATGSVQINSMPAQTAADYLRSKQNGLPILVVPGFMDDDRIRVQNEIEEFYTFPKPYSRDELIAKVSDVLDVVQRRT